MSIDGVSKLLTRLSAHGLAGTLSTRSGNELKDDKVSRDANSLHFMLHFTIYMQGNGRRLEN